MTRTKGFLGYAIYIIVAAIIYWLSSLLVPGAEGISDLFLKGTLIAFGLLMTFYIFEIRNPKSPFAKNLITQTYAKTSVLSFIGFFIGGFIFATVVNSIHMGMSQQSILQNSIILPTFTAYTVSTYSFLAYTLNAIPEDIIFIGTPMALLVFFQFSKNITLNPVIKSIVMFIMVGTLASIAHLAARGGIFDWSTFIVFGILGIIASRYGLINADAAHMGLNAGLVSGLFSVVA